MLPEPPKIQLTEKYDIAVLVCYLLKKIGPLSEEQLIEILISEDAVNYFELISAFTVLDERHMAEKKPAKDRTAYFITEQGMHVCSELISTIPYSIIEKSLITAKEIYEAPDRERNIKIDIFEKNGDYFLHILLFSEENGKNIIDLTLYAPDYVEAIKMKQRFIAKSDAVLKRILNSFTGIL